MCITEVNAFFKGNENILATLVEQLNQQGAFHTPESVLFPLKNTLIIMIS